MASLLCSEVICLMDTVQQTKMSNLTEDFLDVSSTLLNLLYDDGELHELLAFHVRKNEQIIQTSLKKTLQEKDHLESELAKSELQRIMRHKQLDDAKRLVRHERLRNKVLSRHNQKMKDELDILLNEMPVNYKKETLMQLATASLKAAQELCVTSDSNIEPSTDSNTTSATSDTSSDTGIASAPLRLDHNERSLDRILMTDDIEQAFSGRISSSTESDRSSILMFPMILEAFKKRPHTFKDRCFIMGNSCSVCARKFACGKMELICNQCQSTAHAKCRDRLALPCIPTRKVNSSKLFTSVADYCCPSFKPQIPALVAHCIFTIEERGLSQPGLYTIPDYGPQALSLKQKCQYGNCIPNLINYEVNTVCELLKHFFASLKIALITKTLFEELHACVEKNPKADLQKIYDAFLKIPEANRCTMVFLILHLKRVCESPMCQVSASTLARIFTPLLMANFGRDDPFNEKKRKYALMQKLLKVNSDYWMSILKDMF